MTDTTDQPEPDVIELNWDAEVHGGVLTVTLSADAAEFLRLIAVHEDALDLDGLFGDLGYELATEAAAALTNSADDLVATLTERYGEGNGVSA